MNERYRPPSRLANPALQPPEGYASWLEYAVMTFDARPAISHTIFDDTSRRSRTLVENQVLGELNSLRVLAGLAPLTR